MRIVRKFIILLSMSIWYWVYNGPIGQYIDKVNKEELPELMSFIRPYSCPFEEGPYNPCNNLVCQTSSMKEECSSLELGYCLTTGIEDKGCDNLLLWKRQDNLSKKSRALNKKLILFREAQRQKMTAYGKVLDKEFKDFENLLDKDFNDFVNQLDGENVQYQKQRLNNLKLETKNKLFTDKCAVSYYPTDF